MENNLFLVGDLQQKYNNILGRLDMGLDAAIYQKTISSGLWGKHFFSWKVKFSELIFAELNSIV